MEDDPLIGQCRARVGQLISGKWRLDALIGVGGMAAVYMATHRNGSIGAVKILHDEVALNEEVRERFLREAYIANKVGHPGTVKVQDDDVDEKGTPFLVMELLQGESVERRAEKNGGRLSIQETLEIIDQTLAVLEAAHKASIIHRDLKPENLFLVGKSTVKVLDFGIARLREENSRKTQTGMVMGTPSFMAPEQAMGRWNDVDARTDIYAVGATAFTLLTGLPVHEAETAGEMLVAAATRPARSLARVLHGAPFSLVALVDRALAYDRDHRFPNATAFRAELAKVKAALGDAPATTTADPAQAPIIPPTVHGKAAPKSFEEEEAERRAAERAERVETFDPSTNSPEEVENMREVFTLLERSLVARKQYGVSHPETKRRFTEVFKQLASSLMTCDICLAWNFTPYAFVAGENIVWEPEPPWNRIPYQLFSDGVRTMGLVPGLDEGEFFKWLDIITLDPTTDLAPEDDIVTRLWDAGFSHIFHQAIDSFAEGTQDQRQHYENQRVNIVSSAHKTHVGEAAQAWREGIAEGGAAARNNAGAKAKQVLDFLNKDIDPETAARVANLNLQDQSAAEATAAESLKVDDATTALLAARLDTDAATASERFVAAAAEAFIASARTGRSQAVTTPLRRAVDGLSGSEPEKALEMILLLRESVKVEGQELETENLRATMTTEVLSPKTLLEVLKAWLQLPEGRKEAFLKNLSKILEHIQGQHIETCITYLPESADDAVRESILSFMRRTGHGFEGKIASLFASAPMELGLQLVRVLVALESDAAREAITLASSSPHALVRIEALSHLESVGGARVRAEMRKLLDDPQMEVRMAALQAMEKHNISVAGPFLVVRMQEKSFLKLPLEERRQSMQTLSKLRPKRAEELCIELLKQQSLFRSTSLEQTRELAAHYLAEVAAPGTGANALLEQIEKSSGFSNSKGVRAAASAALARLAQRTEELAAARKTVDAARASSTTTVSGGTRKTVVKKKKKRPPGSTTASAKAPTSSGVDARPSEAQEPAPRSSQHPTRSANGE